MKNVMRFEKMAAQAAWKYHRLTGMEFEDLFGEAWVAVCDAHETYEGTKAELSTYVYHRIEWHLKNELRRSKHWCDRRNSAPMDLGIYDSNSIDVSVSVEFMDRFEALGNDVAETVELLIENPFGAKTPAKLRAAVRQCLLGEGYSRSQVNDIYSTIKAAL